jgi:Domain of unknown function (DUF4349)
MSSKRLLWLLPLFSLASCGSADRREYAGAPAPSAKAIVETADSTAVPAANAPINSAARKIILTADFHCKVKNVFVATTKLEQLVKSVGGVVQESHMDNNDIETRTAYYTADSNRQTMTYKTTAQLTLRVPSMHLDSVINAIPGLTSFIDSRTLKQNDVTYKYLTNELKNQVGATTSARVKKSNNTVAAQVYDDGKTEQKIDRKVENLEMQENVNYATVTVSLSEPEQVIVTTVANTDYLSRPTFGTQCRSALNTGWEFVRVLAVLLIRIWPLLILVIIGFAIFRFFFRRQPIPAGK